MKPARLARWIATAAVAVVVVLQFLPTGLPRRNPGITAEPIMRPEARAIAERACFDCHSNRTSWPWYSEVAPMRWLVAGDVGAARGALNFSEFDRPQRSASGAAEVVRANRMPPARYVALHPRASLSPAERETLARGLETLRDASDRGWTGGATGSGSAE